jgi:hypothetical protein
MTLHCFKSSAQTIAVLLIDSVSLSDSVELVVPESVHRFTLRLSDESIVRFRAGFDQNLNAVARRRVRFRLLGMFMSRIADSVFHVVCAFGQGTTSNHPLVFLIRLRSFVDMSEYRRVRRRPSSGIVISDRFSDVCFSCTVVEFYLVLSCIVLVR